MKTMKHPTTMRALALAFALASGAASAHEGAGKAAPAQDAEQTPWGIAGTPRGARTIELRMGDDMRFVPDRIEVRQGETIRFVVRNQGKVLHEMVIGTPQALREHAALMKRFPKMEHDEPHMTHVKPGRKGQIAWNFNRAGEFQFACLIPGHFDAGMLGTIVVMPATPQGNKS